MAIAEKRGIDANAVGFTEAWLNENARRADGELDKLESGLTDLLTERVKENLRMQYVELGDHYYDRGDLKNALACYTRTRDYCSTPKHVVFMCLSAISVSLEMGNFAHVNVHANKATAALERMDEDASVRVDQAKLSCARGIAALRMGRFREAARKFTEINVEIGTHYANVCSAKDVATYGTLCAIASFNRQELRDLILNNQKGAFRAHLEAASDVREVVNDFYNSKYTSCFITLDGMRDSLALDIHLGKRADALYKCIRDRALIQYVEPYVTVDLSVMAKAFNTSAEDVQDELARLIEEDRIRAKIDASDRTLHAVKESPRTKLIEHVIADGERFETETRDALLKMSLLKNDVVTRVESDVARQRRSLDE
jgi:COP9 signalosome complex subunit 1